MSAVLSDLIDSAAARDQAFARASEGYSRDFLSAINDARPERVVHISTGPGYANNYTAAQELCDQISLRPAPFFEALSLILGGKEKGPGALADVLQAYAKRFGENAAELDGVGE